MVTCPSGRCGISPAGFFAFAFVLRFCFFGLTHLRRVNFLSFDALCLPSS